MEHHGPHPGCLAHWKEHLFSQEACSQALRVSPTSLLLGKEVMASALPLADPLPKSVQTLPKTGLAQRGGKRRHPCVVIQ